jgi:hypothetical protein
MPEDLPERWHFQRLRLPGYSWWLLEHWHLGQSPELLRRWLLPCCRPEDLPEHWRFQKLRLPGCS